MGVKSAGEMAAPEEVVVPMEEVYMAFRPMVTQYDKLFDVADPEEEPYKSKYEGRKLMEEWMTKADAALASGDGSEKQNETILDKIATCQLKLGSNHHETDKSRLVLNCSRKQPLGSRHVRCWRSCRSLRIYLELSGASLVTSRRLPNSCCGQRQHTSSRKPIRQRAKRSTHSLCTTLPRQTHTETIDLKPRATFTSRCSASWKAREANLSLSSGPRTAPDSPTTTPKARHSMQPFIVSTVPGACSLRTL